MQKNIVLFDKYNIAVNYEPDRDRVESYTVLAYLSPDDAQIVLTLSYGLFWKAIAEIKTARAQLERERKEIIRIKKKQERQAEYLRKKLQRDALKSQKKTRKKSPKTSRGAL